MSATDWKRVDALTDTEIEKAAAEDPDCVLLEGHPGALFELYQSPRGAYRWRLSAGGGRIVAEGGEAYATMDEARRAIAYLKASLEAPVRTAA